MSCKENESIIIEYVDGNLTPEASVELEQHIAMCQSCKNNLRETQAFLKDIKAVEPALPSDGLRTSFLEMLEEEKKLQKPKLRELKTESSLSWKTAFQIAASILLLVGGFLWGGHMKNQEVTQQITLLNQEAKSLKQDMTLALLDNQSASKRIKAVNYTEEIVRPDTKILEALIDRMNYDANINVRLAAAEALSRFANNERVKEAFIQALTTENNPSIQIAVIEFLVKVHDQRAKVPMQVLLEKTDTPGYIKDHVNEGLVSLM